MYAWQRSPRRWGGPAMRTGGRVHARRGGPLGSPHIWQCLQRAPRAPPPALEAVLVFLITGPGRGGQPPGLAVVPCVTTHALALTHGPRRARASPPHRLPGHPRPSTCRAPLPCPRALRPTPSSTLRRAPTACCAWCAWGGGIGQRPAGRSAASCTHDSRRRLAKRGIALAAVTRSSRPSLCAARRHPQAPQTALHPDLRATSCPTLRPTPPRAPSSGTTGENSVTPNECAYCSTESCGWCCVISGAIPHVRNCLTCDPPTHPPPGSMASGPSCSPTRPTSRPCAPPRSAAWRSSTRASRPRASRWGEVGVCGRRRRRAAGRRADCACRWVCALKM